MKHSQEKAARETAEAACRRYVEKMKRPVAASVAAGVYEAAYRRALRLAQLAR